MHIGESIEIMAEVPFRDTSETEAQVVISDQVLGIELNQEGICHLITKNEVEL